MNATHSNPVPAGRVSSLHIHPENAGGPMQRMASLALVAGMGIQEDTRYFGRRRRSTGEPAIRQVSLIEREVIDQHARILGTDSFSPGAVRANIETVGIDLVALIGRQVQVGEAILLVREPRQPCAKMDALCQGLRRLMEPSRQGVLAQVLRSGRAAEGDRIVLLADTREGGQS